MSTTTAIDKSQHVGETRFALRLAERLTGKVIHVANLGWFYYDGARWVADESGDAVVRRALLGLIGEDRAMIDAEIKRLKDSGIEITPPIKAAHAENQRANGNSYQRGVLAILAALQGVSVPSSRLDADPYLVNVANGTYDLRTRTLRPHNPADMLTKVARGAYDPEAPGQAFQDFLRRILPDEEVREYLQRILGSSLLGKVRDHALVTWTGEGQNGKGTLDRAIGNAYGDYAVTLPEEALKDGTHTTALIPLKGARWAVLSETNEGARLPAGKIKRLTGGDEITARMMRKDNITWTPTHQICLVTNFLPEIDGSDPAMVRRVKVIHFDVTIPAAERRGDLDEILEAEADVVMTWMIDGYPRWEAATLDVMPEGVRQATAEYLGENDPIGRWLADEEEVALGEGHSCPAQASYQAFENWYLRQGLRAVRKPDSAAFKEALQRKGFETKKTKKGMMRLGFALTLRHSHGFPV